MFGGVKIIISEMALEETKVRNFPASKHRSRRIHKKLVARYRGEFKMVPCMIKTPEGFIIHPVMYRKLEADPRWQDMEKRQRHD